MLSQWALSKLEAAGDHPRVLVCDSLRLLPEADSAIHAFARERGYTVLVASTNLVFRELYEKAVSDPSVKKLLILDRAPARRRQAATIAKAPPPFYPDLLADVAPGARIDLDLREFLCEKTGDTKWPQAANDPRYARLIAGHLDEVIRAHANLRTADRDRFSDDDFRRIVACAALGIADSAFKKLRQEDYWRVGLFGHEALEELRTLAPEVTEPILAEFQRAPAPFCWFVEHDPELVLRAFYLSLLLSQHFGHWDMLLANVDPALQQFANVDRKVLGPSALKLVSSDPAQAARDLEQAEESLSKEALQLLFVEKLKLSEIRVAREVLEKEQFSTFVRSLAVLGALDDLMSAAPATAEHQRLHVLLSREEDGGGGGQFVDSRPCAAWSCLQEAYLLVSQIRVLRGALEAGLKYVKVKKASELDFGFFRELWNGKKVNRLEYYVSALERLAGNSDLLPRADNDLPAAFADARDRIRQRIAKLSDDVTEQIARLNLAFQAMVVTQYPGWTRNDGEVVLTSQFLRRCLKPNWDPASEQAIILIFDGMRYDIWEELLRPMLCDRLEVVHDYAASSLIPSETHLSRKAISAGAMPEAFDSRASESSLLEQGLREVLGVVETVKAVDPGGAGTGETVRYRAGKLDVFIFELCDKELHHIQSKELPGGRQVPARPLAFVYRQLIKNLIDTEVMTIVRGLAPGTKVFVVADHGFGPVGREKLYLDAAWLNEPLDCCYLNAKLRQSLDGMSVPAKVRSNVWEVPVGDLRLSATETATDPKTKQTWVKQFATVLFPKTGYALSRPHAPFRPDAFSHGGISLQELLIPMVVLRVKEKEEGLFEVGQIAGPAEVVEGQDVEYRLTIRRQKAAAQDEVRITVDGAYSGGGEPVSLPTQVLYAGKDQEIVVPFTPDTRGASIEERREGRMARVLILTLSYRLGTRTFRKSRTHRFVVQLNSDQVIRRVPAHLGSILGLQPRSMR